MEKMSSGFPSDVLWLLCPSAAFYLANLSPKLHAAGSLHVALKNLCESQS